MSDLGNILIVDDDPSVTEALRRSLTDSGYRAEVALNPGDALMLATLNRPDVIIMDAGSPDADGTRLFAKLQAIDESIRVILLAGSNDEARMRGWLKAGAFDWLRKPVQPNLLEPMVRRAVVFGRKHSERTVVVPFDPERRRGASGASNGTKPSERHCPVCMGSVQDADITAVLQAGDIFHAMCWLKGRARAQRV